MLYPNDTIRRRLQMPGKNEATSYFGVGLALFREVGDPQFESDSEHPNGNGRAVARTQAPNQLNGAVGSIHPPENPARVWRCRSTISICCRVTITPPPRICSVLRSLLPSVLHEQLLKVVGSLAIFVGRNRS